jgi:hypothetical protein
VTLSSPLWEAVLGRRVRANLASTMEWDYARRAQLGENEGWYRDPWLRHEARWFSGGRPTKLVRDGTQESVDPPPSTPPLTPNLVPVIPPPDDVEEMPQHTFQGEQFEQSFGGSRGYDGPNTPPRPFNWADWLMAPVITFVRPSQFKHPAYWTRYVPMIVFISCAASAIALLLYFSLTR